MATAGLKEIVTIQTQASTLALKKFRAMELITIVIHLLATKGKAPPVVIVGLIQPMTMEREAQVDMARALMPEKKAPEGLPLAVILEDKMLFLWFVIKKAG